MTFYFQYWNVESDLFYLIANNVILCNWQDNIEEIVDKKENVRSEKEAQFEKGKEKVRMLV